MSDKTIAPYGSWVSPITSDLIVAQSIGIADVLLDGDDLLWIEARPQDAGRYVMVGRRTDGSHRDLTSAPFNVRTRVHEYGGAAAQVDGGTLWFSNFADQRLYRAEAGADPRPLTPEGPWRYADGIVDRTRNCWIGIREDHSGAGEAVNTVVAVDLSGENPTRILAEGADFYSSPRLSPDGSQLAWLSWSHPNMPWVATDLWLADVGDDGSLAAPEHIAGGAEESLFQPQWSPDGRLHFVSDRSGFWNLYRREQDGTITPLCAKDAEFGQPQWVFGMSTYAFADARRLICSYIEKGLGHLAVLDTETLELAPLNLPYTSFAQVRAHGDRVAFIAGSATIPPSVVVLDLASQTTEVIKAATTITDDAHIASCLSSARPIEFSTSGNRTAHGLFYPPHNSAYSAPDGDKPPLVVMCHGGPTAAARSTLSMAIQYWTSRGIAVFDVNYGGSTGYGREYRNRLQGAWGQVDVDDCSRGAQWLADQGLVDGSRMVITGGSAGGYTTLACLVFGTTFRGGASHYGVSDLEALARDTHKFESRYLDWLIGPYPEQKQLYIERSPIHHADKLSAPVIFFQGDEDQVVPVNQTETMVEALRAKGIPVGYLLFRGEQHGFRKADNIKRSLDAELYFYASLVFGAGLTF